MDNTLLQSYVGHLIKTEKYFFPQVVTLVTAKNIDLIVLLDYASAVEIGLINGFNITHSKYRR